MTFTTLTLHLLDPGTGEETVLPVPGPTLDVTSIARPYTLQRQDLGLSPSSPPLIDLGTRRLGR